VVWKERDKDKLQKIENGVWRKVFGAPSYTPIAALQGEVGCSSVISRDMKSKLNFVKFVLGGKNETLKKILSRMRLLRWRGSVTWLGCVEGYMNKLDMNWEDFENLSNQNIVQIINRWELDRWRREINDKSSLEYYRLKSSIGGENYTSGWGSRLLFMTRTNTVRLNWRSRHWGGEMGCQMCGAPEETLKHFIAECPNLSGVREEFNLFQVAEVLCFGSDDTEHVERFLERLWAVRFSVVGGGG